MTRRGYDRREKMPSDDFELATALGPVPRSAQDLARSLDPAVSADFVAEHAVRLVFPDHAHDPMFREAIGRSALDNTDAMWRIIGGRESMDMTTPLGSFAFAEAAAEVGVPISQFERVYQVGSGLVWLCWYRAALEHVEATGADLQELVGAPSMMIHSYFDHALSPAIERYDATRAETRRTRDHLRRNVLRQALDDATVLDEQDVAEALGVKVDGEHLAIVVSEAARLDAALVEPLRRASEAATALTYQHAHDIWILWLSRLDGFGAERLARLRTALEQLAVTAALGDPAPGVEGLGVTGRDALEASRLQGLLGDGHAVVAFADIRLEALMLGDPAQARRFVRAELGLLDDGTQRARRLQETAMLWLSTGSHVGTAATLGLHEHTVRNRIAQAEELLGRGLVTRRTEILVALRLLRMLEGPG